MFFEGPRTCVAEVPEKSSESFKSRLGRLWGKPLPKVVRRGRVPRSRRSSPKVDFRRPSCGLSYSMIELHVSGMFLSSRCLGFDSWYQEGDVANSGSMSLISTASHSVEEHGKFWSHNL